MRFLIVRTDVRAAADDDVAAALEAGIRVRDEKVAPEARRQVVHADDREAALVLARALSNVGLVRSGRQRVKVLPISEPERFPGNVARTPQQPYPYYPNSSPLLRG
jgi:hypothetical protein